MGYVIYGYDVGEHTKVMKFHGSGNEFWVAKESPHEIPRIDTPHDVPASKFMGELLQRIAAAGYWGSGAIHGFSLCGPVVQGVCLSLINRGIREPFTVKADASANDGFMAMLGSRIAGTAKGHEGALAYFTLGTGIGFGALHWDEWNPRGLATNDGEVHFTVRGSTRLCNCHRAGCFEASANEAALRAYAADEGFTLAPAADLGREFERIITDETATPSGQKVTRAILKWHGFLAQGIANVFTLLNMGGNKLQPPALFVLGGGLSALVKPDLLREYVFEEFAGYIFLGTNFVVKTELILGNRAGCVGAAAAALARKRGRHVTEISFLSEPPAS